MIAAWDDAIAITRRGKAARATEPAYDRGRRGSAHGTDAACPGPLRRVSRRLVAHSRRRDRGAVAGRGEAPDRARNSDVVPFPGNRVPARHAAFSRARPARAVRLRAAG